MLKILIARFQYTTGLTLLLLALLAGCGKGNKSGNFGGRLNPAPNAPTPPPSVSDSDPAEQPKIEPIFVPRRDLAARAAFIKAVRAFEARKKIQLEKLFEDGTENVVPAFKAKKKIQLEKVFEGGTENIALRKKFFSVPEIRDYLGRSSKVVGFRDNHPDLVSDENNKENSDYYELKIYDLAKDFLPYRSGAAGSEFYVKGSRTVVSTLARYQSESRPQKRVFVAPPLDIYQIRHKINAFDNPVYFPKEAQEVSDNRFLLFPMVKDNHASTLVAIFDPKKKRTLVAVFINSWEENSYYEYIAERWRLKGYYYSYLDKRGLPQSVLDEARDRALPRPPKDRDEDYISSEFGLALIVNRDIPLFAAPHHLQTAQDDANCSLYSLNFLNGIRDLLAVPGIADRIYSLAKTAAGDNSENAGRAAADLQAIFQNDLRQHLPIYYNADGNKKTPIELMEYHRNQRWDIGSLFIKTPELLEQTGIFRPVPKVHPED